MLAIADASLAATSDVTSVAAGSATAGAVLASSGGASSNAFCVEPRECVVPAGQQQKFTVKFYSWQVGTHSVNLAGRQCFMQQQQPDDQEGSSCSGGGDGGGLTVTLWPRQQQLRNSHAGGPLEVIVSGGLSASGGLAVAVLMLHSLFVLTGNVYICAAVC
jgi:hypothetical protein